MLYPLTPEQNQLHSRAVYICGEYRRVETELVHILSEVDRADLYRKFDCSSLFKYATEHLGLNDSVAYAFIAVCRSVVKFPQLNEAIRSGDLSVSKCSRLVSALTEENVTELLEFARVHTNREIDYEVARRNPRAPALDRVKPISENMVAMAMTVSKQSFKGFQRVQSLEAQKGNSHQNFGEVFDVLVEEYLKRFDPVRKAERAQKKSKRPEPETKAAAESAPTDGPLPTGAQNQTRQPLSAEVKHAVTLRDRGCCRHIDKNGKRCGSDRFTEIHHILEVSRGGSNDPNNLITLCSFHHAQAHAEPNTG